MSGFCPYSVGEILRCARPTNFHEIGELVVVSRLDMYYSTDPKPYWVAFHGKSGHYDWTTFERATPEEIAAALVPVNKRASWPNGCAETVPAALRYLAEHDRPQGGEQNYNSAHLYQLASEIERAHASRPTDDSLWDQTLAERDGYHETADKLAAALARLLGVEIGEHSSANDPWANALRAAREYVAPKVPAVVARDAEAFAVPNWLAGLSYQQQSVILLALRGPDGVRKHHPAKSVHVAYRGTVLRAAERGRFLEWGEAADSFMSLDRIADDAQWATTLREFFRHVDELPHHYVSHLAHAAEIISYRHPDERMRRAWGEFYRCWCDDAHVNPETHAQMNRRLGDWGCASERLRAIGVTFETEE